METPEVLKRKIYYDFADFEPELHRIKFRNKKIVFTNGCFDLIHLGHIDYLSKAADNGDVLIAGLNSDASVSRLKGPARPVNDVFSRANVLAALFFVDYVIVFDDDTPYQLINFLNPDVLVKGKDYSEDQIVGADVVKKNGGCVITLDLLEGYSSSLTEQRILKNKTNKT